MLEFTGKLTHVDQLRGWKIHEDYTAPVTGKWKATRYGVQMGASTKEQLVSMILNRPE